MAPHSSTLAWKIPWTEEPGRLQSMESLRVGHDWATSLSLFIFIHWRRKWHPTPVFLPGESQRQRSLVGCRLWGRTESDTTEATAAAATVSCREPLRPNSHVRFSFFLCLSTEGPWKYKASFNDSFSGRVIHLEMGSLAWNFLNP